MGTRGAIGFTVDGQDKLTYNHFDSYPEHLGHAICEFVSRFKGDMGSIAEQARAIRMVDEDSEPSAEDIATAQRLGLYDPNVSTGKVTEWYSLLRNAQGDLEKYLTVGLMPDGGREFVKESLFCEYAYVVNLDTGKLEFYKGFVKEPQENHGRFFEEKSTEWEPSYGGENFYYPVALVKEWDFSEVEPETWEEMQRLAYPEDEDAEV